MYSVISVIVNSLPVNTKSGIEQLVDGQSAIRSFLGSDTLLISSLPPPDNCE